MHHHGNLNVKRSHPQMEDAANHLSSSINHFHSSMIESQTAMPDVSLQPQPQQQPHIALPPLVEDLLNQICNDRKQPQPDYDVRRRLGLLGEEKALQLLHEIDEAKVIKTLSGFIKWMIRNKPQYQCASPSPSPSKSAPASLLQTQLSASPITPPVHKVRMEVTEQPGDHGGLRPPYSYSSASPSKVLRVYPYQGQSSAPPSTITPVRLFKDPLPLPQPFPQGETSTYSSVDQPGDNGQAQLEALGELEFRRQFLILNYAGGNKLEKVLEPETIRSWKDLPMQLFETTVWEALGRNYIGTRHPTFDWDSGKTYVYHCEVSVDGSYKFKGPCLNNTKRTLLQKVLGDDNVLMVKFSDVVTEKVPTAIKDNNYANYSKVAREGILVGLRRYQFFVFKDGGNKEKKKNPTSSPVKCYFICVGSNAAIDRSEDYKFSNRKIHETRCIFMHAHTVSSVSNYMARFSLILSKTESLVVDWSLVKVEDIDDEYCLDESGNRIYRDGKPLIHTDGTGFISEDLALLCPKDLLKGDYISKEYIEPLLLQFRLFYKGRAVKGTFLINKTLPPKTIQIRPSMVKVETDPMISDDQTVNSLEIVTVSKSHRNTFFSRHLIALLCHGGVPKEYFRELLMKDLEDTRGVFCSRRAAFKVAYNHGEIDDDYNSVKMILSDIPLEESYLQYRLSILKKEENKSLRKGKICSPQSYMLMGTADPTGILERDEVCVILDSGQMSGEVLVYRHPGLHFGDIHVLKARYVKELEYVVGNAKYAIFFSCKGPRSVADEMGGGDFDGDLYWVSRNPQLLECFKPSEPWIEASSSTPKVASTRPSDLLPNHIEDALIKQFLKTRFEPSFAMSEASDSWLAMMDRLLILGDSSNSEKTHVKANMLRLVDLYYEALDAPKKGGKVVIPGELKSNLFPHYMERVNSYKSTSILGLIYDTVNAYQAEDASIKEVKKLPMFDVEVPEECLKKWREHHQHYRSEMRSAMQDDDRDGKNNAADKVLRKYKEILYGGAEDLENSTRPLHEIFDEALAIYRVTYDHAISQGAVGKCCFAWKVAGSALCKYYMNKQGARTIEVSFSVLKDLV
ncbi:PREDICTED: probable RNA-dependent [Prunus dulcis]|uniref:RNA-dependent RNA polymerase n=1 Tax=Prunus dulcis TaxID=3755 RepID=A0A5E4E3U5_PRUDU|nr:probable RNA-dependent RNA polymerase 5 isoform X1 [Prunus dulcis]VVA10487.1 PREDICTED: probable RNA-dependent [Prunus dulcis]